MSCLTHQQMLLEALGVEPNAAVADHLQVCPSCREQVDAYRTLPERFVARLSQDESGHQAAQERLLAALPDRYPSRRRGSRVNVETSWYRQTRLGAIVMRHRFAFGGTILVTALLLLMWAAQWSPSLSAMEQTAEAIRNEKSFQYDVVYEGDGERSRIYWSAGRVRSERFSEGTLHWVDVGFLDESKLTIDHYWKTYSHIKPREGTFSVLTFVTRLMKVSGEAEQDVGPKRIGQVEARGFRIAVKEIDSSACDGTATVWVAPDSKLPLLVEFEQQSKRTHRLENFRWGVALSPELFDPQPPAEYVDVTRAPRGSIEQVAEITTALRTYAEAFDGHYPPTMGADPRNGTTLSDQLNKQLGIPPDDHEAALAHEAYPRYRKASLGFETIRAIERDNFHFNYFGENVGPADTGKVLMHWELDVGRYRVIYGDLKSTIVTETQLRSLLKPERTNAIR